MERAWGELWVLELWVLELWVLELWVLELWALGLLVGEAAEQPRPHLPGSTFESSPLPSHLSAPHPAPTTFTPTRTHPPPGLSPPPRPAYDVCHHCHRNPIRRALVLAPRQRPSCFQR